MGKINVDLLFTANTQLAKALLDLLKNSLNLLGNMTNINLGTKNLTNDMIEASNAAIKLKTQLDAATNVNTGKLSLGKFNLELKASGLSLADYRQKLSALGPEGQKAFVTLTDSIISADKAISTGSKLLANFGQTLANVAKYQLSTAVYRGFTLAISTAYNYAQDLNKSLNNIRIVTGQSVELMDKFAARANKAAKALSTTTTAYTDAALIFYQQGLNDKLVEKRTNATIKMANVTGDSVKEVSNQLTAIWNNFAKGGKLLEYYVDVITALGAATASSTSEISEGLEKFAAIAETVGLSYEYATTALATVTAETRQSADVVGTAFKTLFARIQDLELGKTLEDGTTLGKYAQALQTIGVNVKTSTGEVKDMNTILDEMGAKWKQIDDATKIATAQAVAGTRQYAQLMALMENWDTFLTNLVTALNSEGELDRLAQMFAEGWEGAKKRVQAAAEEIYSTLLDDKFFISLTNNLGKIIEVIGSLVEGMGGLKGLLPIVTSLMLQFAGPLIYNGVRNLVTSISNALPALASVRDATTGKYSLKATGMKQVAANFLNGLTRGERADLDLKQEALFEAQLLGDSSEYGLMLNQTLTRRISLLQTLVNSAQTLTAEMKALAQAELDIIKNIDNEILKRSEAIDLLKELNEEYRLDIIDARGSSDDTLVKEAILTLTKVSSLKTNYNGLLTNLESDDSNTRTTAVSSMSALISDILNDDLYTPLLKDGLKDELLGLLEKLESESTNVSSDTISELETFLDRLTNTAVKKANKTVDAWIDLTTMRAGDNGEYAEARIKLMSGEELDNWDLLVLSRNAPTDVIALYDTFKANVTQEEHLNTLSDIAAPLGLISSENLLLPAVKELMIELSAAITDNDTLLLQWKESLANGSITADELKQVILTLTQAKTEAAAATKQSAEALEEELPKYEFEEKEINKIINNVKEEAKLRKARSAEERKADAASKKFNKTWNILANSMKLLGAGLTSSILGLASFASAINMILGLGNIISDDNLSTMLKMISILTMASPIVMMLSRGYTSLLNALFQVTGALTANISAELSLNALLLFSTILQTRKILSNNALEASEKEKAISTLFGCSAELAANFISAIRSGANLKQALTENILTGAKNAGTVATIMSYMAMLPIPVILAIIAAAILVIVGIIALVVTAINNHNKALKHDLVLMEQANDAVETLTELVKNAKLAWDDLISELEDYHGALEAINSLTVGTTEYANAVLKLNEQVLALMEKYPELETHWENGHLVIDNEKEAIKALEEEYNKQNLILNSAKLNATSATTTYNRTHAILENVNNNYTGDGHYLDTTFDKIDAAFRSGNEEAVLALLNKYTKDSKNYNAVKQYIDAQRSNLAKEQATMSISNTLLATNSVELKDLDSTSDEYLQIMTALGNQKFNAKKHNDAVLALKNEHKLSHNENYEAGGFKDRAARAVLVMLYGQDPDKIIHNGTGKGRDTWTGPTARIRHGYAANYTVDTWDEEKQQWSEGKSNEFAWTDAAETTVSYEEGKERAENIDKNIQQIRQKRNNINNTISNTALKDLSNEGINNIINGLLDETGQFNLGALSAHDQEILARAIAANPSLINDLANASGIVSANQIRQAIQTMGSDRLKALQAHNDKWFEEFKQQQNDNINALLTDNFELPEGATAADIIEDLTNEYEDYGDFAPDIVEANLGILKSVNDLNTAYIANIGALSTAKEGTREYHAAVSALLGVLLNIFGTETDFSDELFKDANFLETLKLAAGGDFKAFRDLGKMAAEDYIKGLKDDLSAGTVEGILQAADILATGTTNEKTLLGLTDYFNSISKEFGQDKARELAKMYGYIADIDEETKQLRGLMFSDELFDTSPLAKYNSLLDNEYDKYYYINKQIEQAEKNTNALSKAKDKASGASKLRLMDLENQSLEQLISLQEKLLNLATSFAGEAQEKIVQLAAALGVKALFDEYGNLINYAEIMDKIGFDEDAKSNFEDALSTYEEHQEKIIEAQETIGELQDEIFANNYERYTYEVEIKTTLNENDAKRIEYFLGKVEDDIYKVAEAALYLEEQYDNVTEALNILGDSYNELLSLYAQNRISQTDYTDGLLNSYDSIIDNLEALNDYDNKMKEYYGETLSNAIEEMDKYLDRMDKQAEVLSHYLNLLKAGGYEFDFAKQAILLNGLLQQDVILADELAEKMVFLELRRAEVLQNLAAATNDEVKEKLLKDLDDINDLIIENQEAQFNNAELHIDHLKDKLDNDIKAAAKNAEDSITNGLGLDRIENRLANIKNLSNIYLDNTNKIYETNKMINQVNQAIEKTDNKAAKERYKSFIDDIKLMQNKGKLTKTELELAQSRYKVLQAQIALEEAQNAKSIVRLRRDNEGNFGYVYTATDSQVANAQQAVDDAENAYYNKRMLIIQNEEDASIKAAQNLYKDLQDLLLQYLNGEITDWDTYQQLRNEKIKQYNDEAVGHAINLLFALGDEDSGIIGNMTDAERELLNNVLNVNDGIMLSVDENFPKVEEETYDTRDAIQALTNSFIGGGTDEGLTSAVNDNVSAMEALAKRLGSINDANSIIGKLNSAMSAANGLTTAWSNLKDKIDTLRKHYENLILEIQKVIKLLQQFNQLNNNSNQLGDFNLQYLSNPRDPKSAVAYYLDSNGNLWSAKDVLKDKESDKLFFIPGHENAKNYNSLKATLDQQIKNLNQKEPNNTKKEPNNTEYDVPDRFNNMTSDEAFQLVLNVINSLNLRLGDRQRWNQALVAVPLDGTDKTIFDVYQNKLTDALKKELQAYDVISDNMPAELSRKLTIFAAQMSDFLTEQMNKKGYTELTYVNGDQEQIKTFNSINDLPSIYRAETVNDTVHGVRYIKLYPSMSQDKYYRTYITESFTSTLWKSIYNAMTDYQNAIASLDTGGYTGLWGPSGKLAMLHQKEIVLNADDTKNFLQAIDILRSIVSVIDLGAMQAMSGSMVSSSINSANNSLNQNVTIHAEFPNAVNHSEIEQAFDNLVNKASLYANRY